MNRPHVTVNCAMSIDGKIALPTRKQLKISCERDMARTHKLRNECDAVLVGIGTILSDNPKLTVKEKYVKKLRQPVRIILDTNCKTPENSFAVNSESKTLIAVSDECNRKYGENVEILKCKKDEDGFIELNRLLELLYSRGIKTLMVEGGSTVIWNFLRQNLADDLYVYIGSMIIGGKDTPTMADGKGIRNLDDLINLEICETKRVESGILIHYRRVK
ncbi:MAG: 2,5-diamino-6-(ribosylamino)-4(3H)-pyrimidinone 5'-phosphate reductase [Thermoplasmatales archaeon]|nr:MAG: 2,5-diamino-6-(ribosylamino)-4(3H)-pyrimidinone 5'-phosphate reductase [Thermoplasmatales archaeon]